MRAWPKVLAGIVTAFAVAIGVVSFPVAPDRANALPSGASWDPGYIVSDALFYDGHAMTGNDVQNFIIAKGGVRLANWAQSTPNVAADAYCGAYQGSAYEGAFDIIAKVGAACNISQRVLLITLQKEQSLITTAFPSDNAFAKATGFGCPDTAPCDPNVAGFFYQVYYAARQFQIYRLKPNSFNYRAGQTVAIHYSVPGARDANGQPCAAPSVTIRNSATAGLYDYTPYQPNAAAIANPGGSGDSCSSYGNRNFWVFWWNWFGDPHGGDPAWVDAIYQDLLGRSPGNAAATWQNQMLLNGWARSDLVASILQSAEYRQHVVTEVYQSVLGRAPDAGGLSYWSSQIWPAGPYLASQLPLLFLGSDELWQRGGSTAEGWATLMYQYLLGRTPDSGGLMYWSDQTRSAGRGVVMSGIYTSSEGLAYRVTHQYQSLLGHSPDAGGLAYYSNIAFYGGDEQVITYILSSAEYAQRAQARYPADSGIADSAAVPTRPSDTETTTTAQSFSDAIWQDIVGAAISTASEASLTSQLTSGASRTAVATNLYQGASYRTSAITRAYQTALGRGPDAPGLGYWVGQAATPASQVLGKIMITDEAFAASGGTNATWVAKLYRSVLGRSPDASESTYWAGQVVSTDRPSVYARIYFSSESAQRRGGALVTALLGRAATSAESQQYGSELTTKSDEYVGAEIAALPEYGTRAQTRYPAPQVAALGHDLLGAAPDGATASAWTRSLATGTTLYRLASDTYATAAHRTPVITAAYRDVLGRAPDSAGMAYWLSMTGPGGTVRVSQVQEQLLLTDEYYQRAGGTPEGWVSSMYQIVLGRSPDQAALTYWSGQTRQYGRASVLWSLYNSGESASRRIHSLSVALLGRAATPAELAHYAPYIVAYGDEFVGAAFIGTNDYAGRANVLY